MQGSIEQLKDTEEKKITSPLLKVKSAISRKGLGKEMKSAKRNTKQKGKHVGGQMLGSLADASYCHDDTLICLVGMLRSEKTQER